MKRILLLLLCSILAACNLDELLKVDAPGRVAVEALDDPSLAVTLANGVVGDFECAWSSFTAATVMISDQVIQASGNLNQRNWGSRRITADDGSYSTTSCAGAYGIYGPLHTVRFQSEDVFKRLEGWSTAQVPTKVSLQAIVKVYGAYALVALGEVFCEMAIDGSSVMKPADVLQLAKQRFTEALALAVQANNTDMRNMANVGLARVNLDLGDFPAAIAAASAVPTGYVKNATRDESDSRRFNSLCANITCATFGRSASISPTYRDVRWEGVRDPRVNVVTTNGLASDNATVFYYPADKSSTRASAMPIATHREAQLIIAEANARAGNLAAARTIINALHTAASIPAYDPGGTATQTGVIAQVIEERRRELFLEGGHRLNDHLRFRGTPYNQPFKGEPGSFDPAGVDRTGLPYGSTTCFPLPTVERVTNPNIP